MEAIFEALEALQDAGLPTFLRLSDLAYPLLNAAHIIGLALLFGAIVTLDLRIIGAWRSTPLPSLARVLLPVAIFGLGLAVITGGLLFSVHAVKYAGLDVFLLKLVLILAAIGNAIFLHRSPAWRAAMSSGQAPSSRLRIAAFVSILLWTGVLLCGRMIAYTA